jgi:hypothetical protein
MRFAIAVGVVLGAAPAVLIVYVLGAVAWSGMKECVAWWRRRSEE